MRESRFQIANWCCMLVCLAGFMKGCAIAPQTAPASTETGSARPESPDAPQVIVTLAPASPEHWKRLASELAEAHRLAQIGAFPLDSLGVQCIVYRVPEGPAPENVIEALSADPRVESVQLNQVFRSLLAVYNDQYSVHQYGARVIRADLAHRLVSGRGVTIAVVDTGIQADHPDLQGRISGTANFVKGGEQTFSQEHHGTAVAGVIVARANNYKGIFGIAPEAEVLAVKSCREKPPGSQRAVCTTWALAKGIDYAILQGVQILNLSLSGPQDPLLARLIARAVDQGIVVVAAALQEGDLGIGFPASLNAVIPVLASDTQGRVQLSVESQRSLLLAAPGVDILTTAPSGAYDLFSGSSLAAAHVSGTAALLLERDPTLSPARLHAIIENTARPARLSDGRSTPAVGLVDACAALESLLNQPVCSQQ